MKTYELTGAALDWAVAKCIWPDDIGNTVPFHHDGSDYAPSRKWAHGGPIIERERIGIRESNNEWHAERWADNSGMAKNPNQRYQCNHFSSGPTPLVAAMRVFVASKLGLEVQIPEELV